jgi:acid stress-induced BolA-like protein IbaG/YrbA
MMAPRDVQALLAKAFPEDTVRVENPQGDGLHFQVQVISGRFQGKTMVEQHQMVYAALGDSMREAIHALALRTYTPDQWAKAGAPR